MVQVLRMTSFIRVLHGSNKKVAGLNLPEAPWPCGFYSGFPAPVQRHACDLRIKESVGVKVSVNGCLSKLEKGKRITLLCNSCS